MLRILKKTLKYFSITLLVLFLVIISIPFLFKSQIKTALLHKIDREIHAKVNFAELSFSSLKNFPHFTVSLHDASVTGIREFKGDTLMSAKEIRVSFNIYRFFQGRHFEVNSIDLEEPLIYARVLPDGKANYNIMKPDSAAADSAEASAFDLNIDEWSVSNGRIVYDDRLQKTYIEVGGLYHSGSGDFKQEISDLDITTKVSDLTLVYNGMRYFDRKLFEADLLMEMNLKEKKFVFKDHTFRLGDFKFGFNGYFKLLDKGYETDLNFVVRETAFKSLLSLLPGVYQKDLDGIQTKGEFSCVGFIKGVYDVEDHRVPTFHLDLEVKDAMFKYAHLPKAVDHIRFHLLADNPDGIAEHASYDLKVFHVEIDHKPIHGSLFVKGKKDLQVNADIRLEADLAQLEKTWPVDGLALKGLLKSEVKIKGRYNDSLKLFPKVDAFLTLDKGYMKSKDAPLEMDSIHINAELLNNSGQLADTRISLNNMTFLLDDEPFVMSGTIDNLKDYDYHLKIDGLVDLGKLTQLYPIADTRLKGTLDFDITTEGSLPDIETKNYSLLKTSGTLEAKNVSYAEKALADPVHIDDALFTFTPDKIVLSRFKAEFGKSNVTLSGHLFNYMPYLLRPGAPINGDLTLTCDTLDLNEWFPASVSDGGTASSVKDSSAKGAGSEVLVIPKNIGFTIDSDIRAVKFGSMDIDNLDGEIRIKDGVLTLNETGFNALNSKFVLSGDYNTRDTKHPLFDLQIDVEALDINKAYQTFVDPKAMAPASGNFSTVYNLRGELSPDFLPISSSLAGKGRITIDKVSVKGMKLFNHIKSVSKKEEFNNPELSDIVIDTEIKNGKLMLYPFSFKVSKFLAEVEGEQGFNDSINYLIKISVPPFSKLKIPISIIGSTDKPVIKTGKGFDKTDFEKM